MSDPRTPDLSRRALLHTAALSAGVAAAAAVASRPAHAADEKAIAPELGEGDTVLFQGDSITDAGRNRGAQNKANDASGLGNGYPVLIGAGLLKDHPTLKLKVYNRGISGNKVPDLDGRWENETLELKPAVLSVLIGVNDIWHKLNGRYNGTVESYRDGFAALLKRTRDALPWVALVVCEPFVLRCGAVDEKWFPEFDERRAAAKEVADGAGAYWVPFQTMFDTAVESGTEPAYWAGDGVHPTLAGHALMAATWRKVVGV